MDSNSNTDSTTNATRATSLEMLRSVSPETTSRSRAERGQLEQPGLGVPLEIWLLIVSHASRATLKCLRLTSRVTEAAATPILFSHLAVSPNVNSMARAKQVVDSPHLARHVTGLSFYATCLDDRFRNPDRFRHEVLRRRANHYLANIGNAGYDRTPCSSSEPMMAGELDDATIGNMHRSYIEELESHIAYQLDSLLLDLRHICQNLDNLRTISCFEDPKGGSNLDNDSSRRTGIPCNQRVTLEANLLDRGHAQNLLDAAAHSKLEEIRLFSLDRYMLRPSDLLFAQGPQYGATVKRFEMSLRRDSTLIYLKSPSSNRDPLLPMIRLFPNLRDLNLDFEYLSLTSAEIFWSLDRHVLAMTDRFLTIRWQFLERVSFSGIALNQAKLVSFLAAHKSTLRCAALSNVVWCEESDGCIDLTYSQCSAVLPAIHDAGYQGILVYRGAVIC